MILFILRHGATAESDADEHRELSEKGIKEVENIVLRRCDDMQAVAQIYSSPMLRVRRFSNDPPLVLFYPNYKERRERTREGDLTCSSSNSTKRFDRFNNGWLIQSDNRPQKPFYVTDARTTTLLQNV